MFSDRLKQLRREKELTQAQLAAELNVASSTIAMWETGKTSPRAEALPKLATLLGCTVDDLLTEQSAHDRVEANREDIT